MFFQSFAYSLFTHLPICLHVIYRKMATDIPFKTWIYFETQHKKIKATGYKKKKKAFLSSGVEENVKKYAFKYDKSNFHVSEDVRSTMKFEQISY